MSSVWESVEGDSAPCTGLGNFTIPKYKAGKELCGTGLRDICEQVSVEGMSLHRTHALGAELRHPTPKEEINSQRFQARRKGKESPLVTPAVLGLCCVTPQSCSHASQKSLPCTFQVEVVRREICRQSGRFGEAAGGELWRAGGTMLPLVLGQAKGYSKGRQLSCVSHVASMQPRRGGRGRQAILTGARWPSLSPASYSAFLPHLYLPTYVNFSPSARHRGTVCRRLLHQLLLGCQVSF